MPRGKLVGLPRPGADCQPVVVVQYSAPKEVLEDEALEKAQGDIADVLLAVNNLAHPARADLIDFEVEESGRGGIWKKGHLVYTAKYRLTTSRGGSSFQRMISGFSIVDAHRVLVEGDNQPIKTNRAIRNFDPGPFSFNSAASISIECI